MIEEYISYKLEELERKKKEVEKQIVESFGDGIDKRLNDLTEKIMEFKEQELKKFNELESNISKTMYYLDLRKKLKKRNPNPFKEEESEDSSFRRVNYKRNIDKIFKNFLDSYVKAVISEVEIMKSKPPIDKIHSYFGRAKKHKDYYASIEEIIKYDSLVNKITSIERKKEKIIERYTDIKDEINRIISFFLENGREGEAYLTYFIPDVNTNYVNTALEIIKEVVALVKSTNKKDIKKINKHLHKLGLRISISETQKIYKLLHQF